MSQHSRSFASSQKGDVNVPADDSSDLETCCECRCCCGLLCFRHVRRKKKRNDKKKPSTCSRELPQASVPVVDIPLVDKGKDCVRVVIGGDRGVGKTTLLKKRVTGKFLPKVNYTFSPEYETLDDDRIKVNIWDTVGDDRFAAINSTCYEGTHCLVLVYDVSNVTTLRKLDFWLDAFFKKLSAKKEDDNLRAAFPVVVVANKCDKRNSAWKEGEKWCASRGSNYYQYRSSAKTGENVKEVFNAVAEKAFEWSTRSMIHQQQNKVV